MKTLFAAICAAGLAFGAAQAGESVYYSFSSNNDQAENVSFTLGDVTGTLARTDGSTSGKYWFVTPSGAAWSNTSALDTMNADLGLSLDSSLLLGVCAIGNGTQSTLTLSFTDSAEYTSGDTVTLYLTVGSNNSTLTNLSITGLADGYSISYATADGDGFSTEQSFTEGTSYTTLVQIIGTLTDTQTVTVASTDSKDGFGFVALKGSSVPEPATATLGLLALGALALRRRR